MTSIKVSELRRKFKDQPNRFAFITTSAGIVKQDVRYLLDEDSEDGRTTLVIALDDHSEVYTDIVDAFELRDCMFFGLGEREGCDSTCERGQPTYYRSAEALYEICADADNTKEECISQIEKAFRYVRNATLRNEPLEDVGPTVSVMTFEFSQPPTKLELQNIEDNLSSAHKAGWRPALVTHVGTKMVYTIIKGGG